MGEKKMNPSVIFAGLRMEFNTRVLDVSIFDNDIVHAARKAIIPKGREAAKEREGRFRYPFTFDMLIWLKEQKVTKGDNIDVMIFCAIAVMYNFMLRVSNTSLTNTSSSSSNEPAKNQQTGRQHCYLNEDIYFEDRTGKSYPTMAIRQHFSQPCDVSIITFRQCSSKVNRGKVERHYMSRDDKETSNIMDIIINFALTKETYNPEDLFFSIKTERFTINLNRTMINSVLKETAIHFNLPQQHFSTHCLRIGGSSEISASGVPRSVNCRIGIWSENSTRGDEYPVNTTARPGVIAATAGKRKMSVQDLKRIASTQPKETSSNTHNTQR
jgi:hypothetical protein